MTPVICLITGGVTDGIGSDALLDRIAMASRAGVTLVQIRERQLEGQALFALTRRAVDAVRGSRTRIIVNERADVAEAAGAHGVHLRAASGAASRVRAICPPGFLIGRSVHDVAGAVAAAQDGGADYLLFGTVCESRSKPGRTPAGVAALADVAASTPLPTLAVGGMTGGVLGAVARAGAAGFAAISLFSDSQRIDGVVRDANAAFRLALRDGR